MSEKPRRNSSELLDRKVGSGDARYSAGGQKTCLY